MEAQHEFDGIPRGARLVHSEDVVAAAIRRMAEEVSRELADEHPVIIPVLLGGMFTAVELCRHLEFRYDVDQLRVARYRDTTEGGELEWHVRPRLPLSGRTVLLVDDVLDQGVTLGAVIDEIFLMGANRLCTAVLARKRLSTDRQTGVTRPEPDFIGLECGTEYLFGCGMDYRGSYRGLPALYALHEQADT